MSFVRARVETLIIARAYTLRAAASATELLGALARFRAPDMTEAAWRAELVTVTSELRRSTLDADHRLADRDELRRRIGAHAVTAWPQLSDRVLPGLGLGISADDSKTLARLSSRDAWAAAIVSRAQGHWVQGPPPSLPALCDAFAWRRLGLAGKAKRLPAEVRSLFLQQEIEAPAAAPDRLVRQLAARELGVPRADARALREGLVRVWLAGRTIGAHQPRVFSDHVHAVARTARDGVFGERKVFISAVWHQLRRDPAWAGLTLDDFKGRLLTAHRAGELVLARADLVAAMSPELVAASETVSDGASFHFIVREAS